MQPVSAADSVSLAIERTKEFLFRPFKWSTYLKLGLVAIVTEGLGSNFHSSTSHAHRSTGNGEWHGPPDFSAFHLTPEQIAIIAAAVALAIVLSCFVFYLITRLRFAFFHSLIHDVKEIGPGWRQYRAQASRFFWLNIVVGVCFVVLMVLVAMPFAAGFWRLFHESQQGGHFDVGLMLAVVLPFIPIILLLVIAAVLSDLILRDCMMPHMALDNATAGEAWRQVRARIKAEKRQFLVYAILRVILPTVAAIATFIVLAVPGLLLAGTVAVMEWGIHSAFTGSTGSSWFVGIALQVFFGVVAFGFALLASICVGGPLSTGVREYALVFYGGRYQALGDALYPTQAIAGGASGHA
ncbi:MAG TPA: hypothetical protein VGG45_14945 [Terracidiphilus sp.]|jgi:hypothetical protein